jgi:hypothetical protein
MVARWCIDAKFGYKQNVVDLMQRWLREIAPQVGFSADKTRLLTGSIGALEATIQTEHVIKDLGELNRPGTSSPRLPPTSSGARSSSRTWFPGPAAGRSTAFCRRTTAVL